mmetsp:Transcript_14849/g.36304  ORF Transcript_14849/g.36304 Transcript_14849/m.36304 type:complete len:106 (-) Transcript_14849:212-529(-)
MSESKTTAGRLADAILAHLEEDSDASLKSRNLRNQLGRDHTLKAFLSLCDVLPDQAGRTRESIALHGWRKVLNSMAAPSGTQKESPLTMELAGRQRLGGATHTRR